MPQEDSTARTKSNTRARTWLTPDQVSELKAGALEGRYQSLQDRDHATITLLYDTGLRVGEFVALNRENLVLDESPPYLKLQESIQKGGGPGYAELEIDRETATELRRYFDRRPWDTEAIFPSREGDRGHANSVRRSIKRAAERVDVRPHVVDENRVRGDPTEVTPHTLRHSVAYRMIREEGARMVDVQLRLRHADLKTTTRIYGHLKRR